MKGPLITTMSVLRRKLGLTQTELAAKCGVNQADVSIQEGSETRTMREDALKTAAETLGVTTEELLLPYEDFVRRSA